MPFYKVRAGLYLHLNGAANLPGTILEMSEEEAAHYAHKLEPVTGAPTPTPEPEAPKPTTRRRKPETEPED